MNEMPEEMWLQYDKGTVYIGSPWARGHSTSYTRTDLIETLKKTHIEHTTLEEEDYYPTFLKGDRSNFEGEVLEFTADEIDTLAERFYNGDRRKLRDWLEKVDKEYLSKKYDEQLRYKTDIPARLMLAERRYKR